MEKEEEKQRERDYFRSFPHTSKGFLLYRKYHITLGFLYNWSFLHSLSEFTVWVYFHAVSHGFGTTLRAVTLQQLGPRESACLKHLLQAVLSSFHRPPASVLRSATKHMPVLQDSCGCFGPPKAFSLALTNIFHGLIHKCCFLQEKGELVGNVQRLCYPSLGRNTTSSCQANQH